MGSRQSIALAALAIVGLGLSGAGCGGDDGDAGCDRTPPESYEEVRLEVREPEGASPAQIDRAAEIVCRRTAALGIEEAAVRTVGTREIIVSAPEDRAAEVDLELARGARLRFYAWEANLIAGGGTAEEPLSSYAEAERVASTRDDGIVLRAEPPLPGFVAIRNRPVLRNEDIREIGLQPDPQTGGPSITLEFSEQGRRRFTELTRRVVRESEPGSPARFAVVVDAEIVAVPQLDPAADPNGLASPAVTLVGAIPFEEAELLTEMLEIGHLPIALEPAPAGSTDG